MAVMVERRLERAAREAVQRAAEHLLAAQDPQGWWKGELQTNVTMDAEDLLMRHILGIRNEVETRQSAEWIRSQQRADGTWANAYGAPPDLSSTFEAYVALRLAGDPADASHMARAAEFIRDGGGLAATRVFTRIWLAMCGHWSWDELPVLPPEMVLLPHWAPLNIYDFACWARQTIVALTVVGAYRPSWPLPFSLDELRASRPAPPSPSLTTFGWFLQAFDRVLAVYSRRPVQPLRDIALSRAECWILKRQEADGSWGGIQPPWVYSLIALHLRGYPIDHPVMQAGLQGLDKFTIVENGQRRLEACQSPVWDTALAVVALSDAGVPADHPALVKAADWLLSQEVRTRGDWAVRRPDLAAGGWAFEFANVNYPDIDDTAEVVLALRRVAHPEPERIEAAIERAVRWTRGMQNDDGGWGAFDADNTQTLCREIPFCDFGEVIDPPTADVTAHAVEMLAGEGLIDIQATQHAIEWLERDQTRSGSWFGRWGANHVYGTAAAVPALVAAGVRPEAPVIHRAFDWLKRHQNGDGGWGEDLRSYRDPAWIGRGESTASQTAWALLALMTSRGNGERAGIERGVTYLLDTQRSDGTWDEDLFTGTGFPGDFYINYHLYRLIFPVMALGRFVGEASAQAKPRAEQSPCRAA